MLAAPGCSFLGAAGAFLGCSAVKTSELLPMHMMPWHLGEEVHSLQAVEVDLGSAHPLDHDDYKVLIADTILFESGVIF